MKKEVILAVLIGLSMGLFITYGVYRFRTSLTENPTTDLEEATEPSPATASDPALIAIHNPENGTVQTENETTVTGTTSENAHVVLFVNDKDYISTSDATGNFTFTVDLEDGTNILAIHVLNETGTTAVDERIVIVTDLLEEKEVDTDATGSATTTTETTKDDN